MDLSLLDYITDTIFLVIALILLFIITNLEKKINSKIDVISSTFADLQKIITDLIDTQNKEALSRMGDTIRLFNDHMVIVDNMIQSLCKEQGSMLKQSCEIIDEERKLIKEQLDKYKNNQKK